LSGSISNTPNPKQTLRQAIRTQLSALLPGDFSAQGAKAAVLLRESPYWERYKTVLLFLSLERELDTQPLLDAALEAGKQVFVPCIEKPAKSSPGRLSFYRIVSTEGPWAKGPFGIREPLVPKASGKPGTGPEALPLGLADFPALVIVPGMAFDRQGRRLGRGGGYYDRYLAELDASNQTYQAIGLCMNCQLVEEVPVEKWDRKMSGVCTEKEFHLSQ
jgi:5-formyltetrahydrofolate cyclo-ligase